MLGGASTIRRKFRGLPVPPAGVCMARVLHLDPGGQPCAVSSPGALAPMLTGRHVRPPVPGAPVRAAERVLRDFTAFSTILSRTDLPSGPFTLSLATAASLSG